VADAARLFCVPAQPGDLVVLCRELRQGLGLEVGEFGDGLFAVGEALLEPGDLVFQAVDLGVAMVGRIAGLAQVLTWWGVR
jgi:hypothetical protein